MSTAMFGFLQKCLLVILTATVAFHWGEKLEHKWVDRYYAAHPHYVYLFDAGNHHDPVRWETESYVRPKTRAIIEIATADPVDVQWYQCELGAEEKRRP